MITIIERDRLSGNYVVETDRQSIGVDSVNQTVKIVSTSSIERNESVEFSKALELANMIALGELSLNKNPHWVNLDCTVSGMAKNTKGYVLKDAFYYDEDGLFCVESDFSPLPLKPENCETIILTRNSEDKYQVRYTDIEFEDFKRKKNNNFSCVVQIM